MPVRKPGFRLLYLPLEIVRSYWLPLILIFGASYILDAYAERTAVRVIRWVLYISAVFGVVSSFIFRNYALKRWGGQPDTKALANLARAHAQSPSYLLYEVAFETMLIGFGTALSAILLRGGWLSLGLFLFSIGWSCGSRLSTPPFVLFCGISSDGNRQLARELVRNLLPSRVVHLLSLPSMDPVDQSVLGESFRTLDQIEWQQSVAVLMKLARIIVIDCRDTTPSLVYEAKLIFTSDFVRKTIFIGDKYGDCPLFQHVAAEPTISLDVEVYILPERMAVDVIHRVAASPTLASPAELLRTRVRTLGSIIPKTDAE